MRFIEINPQRDNPLTLIVDEDITLPSEDEQHAVNLSLITPRHEELAYGRCSIYREPEGRDYLMISAIYVEGNENNPTIKKPNPHVGLGQLLVYAAMKFGHEQNVQTTLLSPLPGSEGFYIKMGFYPKVTGNPNRMVNAGDLPRSHKGKLNPKWLTQFAKSSFLHQDFRGSIWAGSTSLVYLQLKENILKSWTVA